MSLTTLPADLRPSVVLHVGMGKTGTSSIQATFHRSRQRLAKRGILYPRSPGSRRHIRLGLAMQPDVDPPRRSVDWRRQQFSTPAELRPSFEEGLFAELRQTQASLVLMSDEALLGSEAEGLSNLRDLLDRLASSVRVVVYLRRQDDHVCSRYQQVVKRAGEVRRLKERVTQMDLSRVYDYHARLSAWQELVRPDVLVVRAFERDGFRGGSLLEDFVDAAGLEVQAQDLAQVADKNTSLDAETVEFLRIRNAYHSERGETPALATTQDVVRRLENAPVSGPTLTLPADDLDRFMSRWERCNRAVARDFVPGGPDALFRNERTSRHTTTDQYLDPARVDHFVTLAGLPDQMRSPLRRIAEREAAG